MKRTGTVLHAWTRNDGNVEILSVMTATLLASVESISLALGCPSPQVLRLESEQCHMLVTRPTTQVLLAILAPREVSEARLRRLARILSARIERDGRTPTSLGASARAPLKETPAIASNSRVRAGLEGETSAR